MSASFVRAGAEAGRPRTHAVGTSRGSRVLGSKGSQGSVLGCRRTPTDGHIAQAREMRRLRAVAAFLLLDWPLRSMARVKIESNAIRSSTSPRSKPGTGTRQGPRRKGVADSRIEIRARQEDARAGPHEGSGRLPCGRLTWRGGKADFSVTYYVLITTSTNCRRWASSAAGHQHGGRRSPPRRPPRFSRRARWCWTSGHRIPPRCPAQSPSCRTSTDRGRAFRAHPERDSRHRGEVARKIEHFDAS